MRLGTIMMSAFDRFAERPALAERRSIPTSNEQISHMDNGVLDAYETLTYKAFGKRVTSLAPSFRTGPGAARQSGRATVLPCWDSPELTTQPSTSPAISQVSPRFRFRPAVPTNSRARL